MPNILEDLKKLLSAGQQIGKAVQNQSGNSATLTAIRSLQDPGVISGGKDILSSLSRLTNPVNAMVSDTASGLVSGASKEFQAIKGELDKAGIDALKAKRKQQVSQAIDDGVPEEAIVNEIMRDPKQEQQPMGNDVLSQLAMLSGIAPQASMQGAAEPQAAVPAVAEPQVVAPTNAPILKTVPAKGKFAAERLEIDADGNFILHEGGFFATKSTAAEKMAIVNSIQQFKGMQPLQQGEREELQAKSYLDMQKEMLKSGLGKGDDLTKTYEKVLTESRAKPSSEQTKMLAQAKTTLKTLDEIEQTLSNRKIPFGKKRREFENAINLSVETIGRLESGGQISKEESANFKNMLPKSGINLESSEEALNKITRLRGMLGEIAKTDQSYSQRLSQAVQSKVQAGHNIQDVLAELRAQGVL